MARTPALGSLGTRRRAPLCAILATFGKMACVCCLQTALVVLRVLTHIPILPLALPVQLGCMPVAPLLSVHHVL